MSDEKKKVGKISRESAKAQVQSFLDFYEIEREDLPDQIVAAYDFAIAKLAKHAMKGRVELNGHDVKMTTKDGKVVPCSILKGKHKIEMDKCKQVGGAAAKFALIGAITGLHPAAFEKFEGVDLSVVECLTELFLLV